MLSTAIKNRFERGAQTGEVFPSLQQPVSPHHSHRPAEPHGTKTSIHLACSHDELANCYRLVYKAYLRCGYTALNPREMRINLWNLLPGTYTLIAKKGGHLAGTLSCVMDSAAGLPTDRFSSDQMQKLRTSNQRLCELSGLAVNQKHADMTTIPTLFRYAFMLTRRYLKATDLIITVHPRHAAFYKNVLLFEELTKQQQYTHVNGAPGVLLRLDLKTMRERFFEKYSRRPAGRDLHALCFVKDQDQLAQSISSELRERQSRLDQKELLKLMVADIDVIHGEHALRAVQMQWDAWHRAQASPTALLSSQA